MKERPIIFNTEMVKAILEGRKTQTRRVMKPQPRNGMEFKGMIFNWKGKAQAELEAPATFPDGTGYYPYGTWMYHPLCPYGQAGDKLWVREAWGYHGSSYYMNKNTIHIRYLADGEKRDINGDIYCSYCGLRTGGIQTPKQNLKYPLNFNDLGEDEQLWIRNKLLDEWWKSIKTIPSIHMPRWASRITLENEPRMEVIKAPARTADDYDYRWARVAPKWTGHIILPDDLIWHWDWDFRVVTEKNAEKVRKLKTFKNFSNQKLDK